MAVTKVFSSADNLCDAPDGAQFAVGTIAGPASYATGGFAADPETDLGLGGEPNVIVQASNGMTCNWIGGATKKIKVYGALAADAATELSAAEDISSVTFTLFCSWKRD